MIRFGGRSVVSAEIAALLLAAAALVISGEPTPMAEQSAPLRLIATLPMPGVQGRIDHLALDSTTGRLFVAALGNDTVEVLHLTKTVGPRSIDKLGEPQGVLFLANPGRLFVTNGETATVSVFSGNDLVRTADIRVPEDPDNIRFENAAKRVWVGAGSGSKGALVALDTDRAGISFEIPLDGHPESFQLEEQGPRIFVNVPSQGSVEVVDRLRRRVTAKWKLPHAANFPMAIDEARGQVLIGCRRPPRLLILEAATGTVVGDFAAPGDADDLFVDATRDRVYVSGGEGIVRVYARRSPNELAPIADIPTGAGARTSLFDPDSGRLYVAVPAGSGGEARILVFAAEGL